MRVKSNTFSTARRNEMLIFMSFRSSGTTRNYFFNISGSYVIEIMWVLCERKIMRFPRQTGPLCRSARRDKNKLQSSAILTLNKSSTVQYTFLVLDDNLYKQSIRVTCIPKVL